MTNVRRYATALVLTFTLSGCYGGPDVDEIPSTLLQIESVVEFKETLTDVQEHYGPECVPQLKAVLIQLFRMERQVHIDMRPEEARGGMAGAMSGFTGYTVVQRGITRDEAGRRIAPIMQRIHLVQDALREIEHGAQ